MNVARQTVKRCRLAWNLLRIARDSGERWSVLQFCGKYVLHRVLPNRFLTDDLVVRLQGLKHTVGVHSGEIGVFEELYVHHAYDSLEEFIPRPDWVVFDVGANAGFFAIQQASRGASVYAFEPNPEAYGRLEEAVRVNDLTGAVTMFACALGAKPGFASIVDGDRTTVASVSFGTESSEGYDVEVDSLDELVPRLDVRRIDLLKIDVEGAEADVLRGASITLECVERVVVEYHSEQLLDRVSALLSLAGFTLIADRPAYPAQEQMNEGVLFAARRPAKTC